jgi:hypothetical protein
MDDLDANPLAVLRASKYRIGFLVPISRQRTTQRETGPARSPD